MRAGKVRILFGSTQKMGTGANVQERLIALHHLDAPWRPADVEQRAGRILRQGTTNPGVQILRYVTEESFDAYMWQTLETKARFIAQVMNGESDLRRIEDVDGAALTYAEVKAIASGNPMVIEKASMDAEVARLAGKFLTLARLGPGARHQPAAFIASTAAVGRFLHRVGPLARSRRPALTSRRGDIPVAPAPACGDKNVAAPRARFVSRFERIWSRPREQSVPRGRPFMSDLLPVPRWRAGRQPVLLNRKQLCSPCLTGTGSRRWWRRGEFTSSRPRPIHPF